MQIARSCSEPHAALPPRALNPSIPTPPQLLLLENTRFHPGDVGSCPAFAAALGRLADVFVNDAFGVCHRDQGSVTGVAATVPRAFPGLLVRDELRYLFATLDQPQR